ncbi:1-acyl-sn-glycerol-3-phosphate acyltransferase [Fluviicoccus keumensis]|uniref:1-acyl-sn-glycerol-3-phosphate acyltransferase n=1 Tax=Fluviicoccus keumensis TaxID=1435465 RepID=A0A4Q7YPH1_9GAMM|nr:lysophospholipid acyltransferase family protein [Fluviicoccus keumensis]RZU38629.1 1-acyl-sn-glycerol-3-phosphate acyltransferase [Fluviicoccus keumensis]
MNTAEQRFAPTPTIARRARLSVVKNPAPAAKTPSRLPPDNLAPAPASWTPEGLNGPDPRLMKTQRGFTDFLLDRYFRLELDGWANLPAEPALLIGVHSGGPLTMDAWTIGFAWYRRFGTGRTLHATAHDVLMKTPGLGRYFRRMGVISPSRDNIQAAFEKGDDVILWPGGEKDAFRSWRKRDTVELGGRTGFIKLAIRTGRPIVPVATVGGHDTLFVLSEGRGLAKRLNLKKWLRSEVAPVTLSWPLGLAVHVTPLQHLPLPAKIRTEFLEPIRLSKDPAMADDDAYVQRMYHEVEARIQAGMDRLAAKRRFPVFG